MNSIAFPKMFNTRNTIITSDRDAAAQNLKLLLTSNKYELFCDPEFGAHLKQFFFNKNNVLLRDIIIDDVYTAIIEFMPDITVQRESIDVIIDKRDVYLNIICIHDDDKSPQAMNIKLMEIVNE